MVSVSWRDQDLAEICEQYPNHVVDPNKLKQWMEIYEINLIVAKDKFPDQYLFDADQVPVVATRMLTAFITGSYLKKGKAIQNTCKKLGIPNTYWAINTFLAGKWGTT